MAVEEQSMQHINRTDALWIENASCHAAACLSVAPRLSRLRSHPGPRDCIDLALSFRCRCPRSGRRVVDPCRPHAAGRLPSTMLTFRELAPERPLLLVELPAAAGRPERRLVLRDAYCEALDCPGCRTECELSYEDTPTRINRMAIDPVTGEYELSPDAPAHVVAAVRPTTVLVTIMLANNETGASCAHCDGETAGGLSQRLYACAVSQAWCSPSRRSRRCCAPPAAACRCRTPRARPIRQPCRPRRCCCTPMRRSALARSQWPSTALSLVQAWMWTS